MDGEWGDWIALWGLINMLQITSPGGPRRNGTECYIQLIVKTKRKLLEIRPYFY